MSKKVCNLNLDEETIKELDEFAEIVGLSRSAAANMLMKSTLSGDPSAVLQTLAATVKKPKRSRVTDSGKVPTLA